MIYENKYNIATLDFCYTFMKNDFEKLSLLSISILLILPNFCNFLLIVFFSNSSRLLLDIFF